MRAFLRKLKPLLKGFNLKLLDERELFITCPGASKHRTPSAREDCRIALLGGRARASCQHENCWNEVAQLNAALLRLSPRRARRSRCSHKGREGETSESGSFG